MPSRRRRPNPIVYLVHRTQSESPVSVLVAFTLHALRKHIDETDNGCMNRWIDANVSREHTSLDACHVVAVAVSTSPDGLSYDSLERMNCFFIELIVC